MPTLPWDHANWNEDAPEYQDNPLDATKFKSAAAIDDQLDKRGVDAAILAGHVVRFLPALPSGDYGAAFAAAYNELLKDEWLESSERLKGNILVDVKAPKKAVEEIEKYAEDPDMVSVLIYGGNHLLLGNEKYHPIYEAAEDAELPITVHSSGNPIHRQTAGGLPRKYVTYDTNLIQNHMSNLVSMLSQRVFDHYPNLDVVWAAEGVSWILYTLWRSTRYLRNEALQAEMEDLKQEPHEYLDDNLFVTTYPLPRLDDEGLVRLFEMIGIDNIIFGSGYPYWDADNPNDLPDLSEERESKILQENAARVYNL
jgi:predicted TIM-barrel fold metal-dependent hydrolase